MHGKFYTTISNFAYLGHRCKKCADDKLKSNINDILIEFKIKHDNFYNYDKIGIIKNNKTKIVINCSIHGDFKQSVDSHLRGGGCIKCHHHNIKYDFNKFVEKSNNIHKNKYTYYEDSYNGTSSKLKINCQEHGDFFQLGKTHINGGGCFKCSNFNIKEEVVRLSIINKDKYNYKFVQEDFKTIKTKVRIICKKHGEFTQSIYSHSNGSGCPICKSSKGELKIINILEKFKISYFRQKKFEDCKSINKLSFDFYLPKLNLLIEFDGIQHFKPVKLFGGEKEFEKTKIKDKIKTDYCINNNIELIRISYLENIEEKLSLINKLVVLQC